MKTESGELTDWKQKYKAKKIQNIHLSKELLELKAQCESNEKELISKNKAIDNMIEVNLCEFVESDRPKPRMDDIKHKFIKM